MICAVIVAAGTGSRMQAAVKKQYLTINATPILAHTLSAFDRFNQLDRIVLVVPKSDLEKCREQIVTPLGLGHVVNMVAGGERRQESVRNGLNALVAASPDDIVMIHDGVRPFVRSSLMARLISGARQAGGCIPTVPVTDTLKQVDDSGMIVGTLDRRRIHLAQTPQTFSLELIQHAHLVAAKNKFMATDDASVAEYAQETVTAIPGDRDNIKITTPEDLIMAQTIFDRWYSQRSGTP